MKWSPSRLLQLSLLASALHAGCGGSDSDSTPGNTAGSAGKGSAGKAGASGAAGKAGSGAGGSSAGGSAGKGGAGTGGAGAAGAAGAAGGAAGAGASGAAGSGASAGSSAGGSSAGGTSAGGSSAGGAGGSGGSGAAGSGGSSAGSGGGGQGGAVVDPVVGLKIVPENPIIEVIDGAIPPALVFQAKQVKQSGAEETVGGAWSFDALDIASMGAASGALTATGLYGGKGTVVFTLGNDTTSTNVTIKLRINNDTQGVPDDLKNNFQNPTGGDDPALSLLYPYDQTVFPRGLLGPEIQWNGGGPSDLYRLFAHTDTFEYEAWFQAPAPSRFSFPTAPTDVWKKLTNSVVGNIQVDLQRWDGAQVYKAKTQTWRVASANLAGTIYYTALDPAKGDVRRLSPGATASESFLQTNGRCIACHTVSSNGQRIIAGFDGGSSPWGVFDAATGSELYDSKTASGFQAMSPEGDYVLWGQSAEGNLTLSAYNDKTPLATLGTGAGVPVHPAWSHDGTRVAMGNRTDGNWLDFANSTLWLTTVTTSPPQFSDIKQIVGNTPDRPSVTFPSFTPDSKWVAFMRATQARTQNAFGELWMADGNGAEIPLDALNGTGYLPGGGSGDANRSFEPSFLPLAAGGYFWVVFSSTRAYGNYAGSGTLLQLWVAAIEQNPQPGQDPSHPAFRLPGQDLNVRNMRGQWARAVCKPLGQTCEAGFDCCDGFCIKDAQGQPVCSGKPAGCVGIGNACEGKADCCGAEDECINGFCAPGKP